LSHALRTMFPNAGAVVYLIYSIEFQKRGLPHAHILIKYANDCLHPSDIDKIISAHIPENEADAALHLTQPIHYDIVNDGKTANASVDLDIPRNYKLIRLLTKMDMRIMQDLILEMNESSHIASHC